MQSQGGFGQKSGVLEIPQLSLPHDSLGSPIVFAMRPHPAFWLPIRPASTWARTWGNTEFILNTDGGILPYGQDRLILILLITAAFQQRTRHIQLPTAFQVLRLFGQPPSGRNYQRLTDRLSRIRSARFTVRGGPVMISDRICESASLWYDSPDSPNTITLSETFWFAARQNALPLELPVVRALSDSPSTLDFYTWLAARSYAVRPDRYAQVALFGAEGLNRMMGVPGDERDFRKRIRAWLRQLRDCWRVCPAVLAEKGDMLMVCRVQPPRVAGF